MVVTGWLGTALAVVTMAAFAGAVAVFTGSLRVGATGGARPADPLVAGLAKPTSSLVAGLEKPGENAAAEYGAAAPGSADITWCSAACPRAPADST
ncbi:MAG: hypothetical protein JO287_02020 [Pseudonocardiales bacterium]|nr:hypothetical protein [Pseudonocardiales bacterium]